MGFAVHKNGPVEPLLRVGDVRVSILGKKIEFMAMNLGILRLKIGEKIES